MTSGGRPLYLQKNCDSDKLLHSSNRRMKLVSWTPESGTDDTQPQTFCKGEAVFVRLNKLRHQVSVIIVFDGYSLPCLYSTVGTVLILARD